MYAPLLDIIRAIGLGAAMKLVERFGGVRIYLPLPENIGPDNEVAKAIGVEAARKLAEMWGQERPTIPLARWVKRDDIKNAVLRDRDTLTVPELARKHSTTERNIYRYLAEGEDEPNTTQRSLF